MWGKSRNGWLCESTARGIGGRWGTLCWPETFLKVWWAGEPALDYFKAWWVVLDPFAHSLMISGQMKKILPLIQSTSINWMPTRGQAGFQMLGKDQWKRWTAPPFAWSLLPGRGRCTIDWSVSKRSNINRIARQMTAKDYCEGIWLYKYLRFGIREGISYRSGSEW